MESQSGTFAGVMLTMRKQLRVFTWEVVLKMMPNADVPFQAEIKGKKEITTIFFV